jgi:hypothetical protein
MHVMHYREYPKIGNCPVLPVCIILHVDRKKKGSFLFLGFPCTKTNIRVRVSGQISPVISYIKIRSGDFLNT